MDETGGTKRDVLSLGTVTRGRIGSIGNETVHRRDVSTSLKTSNLRVGEVWSSETSDAC